MVNYFKVLRPWQWIKNLVIFIPYILGSEDYINNLFETILIFIIFSLFVSSTYIFNDIKDVNLDKSHPTKKNRPIASGKIDTNKAMAIGLAIFVLTLLGSYFINSSVASYFLIYAVVTFFYTYIVKYIFLMDTIFISFMYVIRVLIGGAISEIVLTPYLVIFIFFTSCFLSTSKKISIINDANINDDNKFFKLLKKQNKKYNFIPLYLFFSILSTGSLFLWFFNLYTSNISRFSLSMLSVSIFSFVVFVYYIFNYSISGELEDFSSAIFKNRKLLIMSLIIVVSFYLGYF